MFRGVVIEESLEDKDVLKGITIVHTKNEPATQNHKTPWLARWTLHTIEVPDSEAEDVAQRISLALDSHHAWYADFKSEATHYIIFRQKIFCVDRTSKEQYDAAKAYGLSLNIPEYQVDFHPEVKQWKH